MFNLQATKLFIVTSATKGGGRGGLEFQNSPGKSKLTGPMWLFVISSQWQPPPLDLALGLGYFIV